MPLRYQGNPATRFRFYALWIVAAATTLALRKAQPCGSRLEARHPQSPNTTKPSSNLPFALVDSEKEEGRNEAPPSQHATTPTLSRTNPKYREITFPRQPTESLGEIPGLATRLLAPKAACSSSSFSFQNRCSIHAQNETRGLIPASARLSSWACGPRNLMKITSGKIAVVGSGEVAFFSGEFETVHLSDPERACLSE